MNDVSARSASGAGLMIVGDDDFQTDLITSKNVLDMPPQVHTSPPVWVPIELDAKK